MATVQPMERRHIGSLEVSLVGLGCNNFGMTIDEAATREVVGAALDAGINYFDTADAYGGTKSEEFLGRAIKGHRDDVVVATKFGHPATLPEGQAGGAPEWIRQAVEASLRRLGTDRIDHYQLHVHDETTAADDTLATLQELIDEGKVVELGCSNFTADQIDDAAAAAGRRDVTPYRSCQNRYSVLTRDAETEAIPACARNDMAFVPYFPLESGMLTGKYTSTEPPADTRLGRWEGDRRDMFLHDAHLDAVGRLSAYATARGRSILELALSWLAGNPAVATIIAGATKPEQVTANAAGASWLLGDQERQEIAQLAATTPSS